MAWTDLSSAFTYNSQLTSAQQRALRDNITALANGDAGAPRIQQFALGHQPKNLINFYSPTALRLDGHTGPFLFYKNAYDKALCCRLFGAVACSHFQANPSGNTSLQLKAVYDGQTYAAAVTLRPWLSITASQEWHTIAILDLSEIPNDVMLEISLYSNESGSGYTPFFHFDATNVVFHTSPF